MCKFIISHISILTESTALLFLIIYISIEIFIITQIVRHIKCIWIYTEGKCISSHGSDFIVSAMDSQITISWLFYSDDYSGANQKTSKLCVTVLCEGNSPVTGKFPTERVSNAENVSIWWSYHAVRSRLSCCRALFSIESPGVFNHPTSLQIAIHSPCTSCIKGA